MEGHRRQRFQPTLPARGATAAAEVLAKTGLISTHAPRTGSDLKRRGQIEIATQFQPTLPARGATLIFVSTNFRSFDFNPRSPHGERRVLAVPGFLRLGISTHAPRTGSDVYLPYPASFALAFQPTLPARGATCSSQQLPFAPAYFNPRSPHGERPVRCSWLKSSSSFQPTLPARGATLSAKAG